MSRPLLEVIALTVQDAVAAETGGADRLELVADMAADGLSPDVATVSEVRSAVDLPIRVMLRLADGFAAGDADAVRQLRTTADTLRAAGADAWVFGFLDETGQADLAAVAALTDVIGSDPWTFHRAIDHAADRGALRKQLDGPGAPDTYLTAGSPRGVDDGLPVLAAEAARTAAREPGHQPRLMAGGGLRLEHLPELRAAGVDAFHIGGAARPQGWDGPVDAAAVRRWRDALG
ncbi:copper homeostasis protein CutC [Streptomyces bohaiensis]|uniref:copper homeostasis protein CutC n=1 Tax=Streptomyces bohaiensis TaxID=1431344 RepID=UPI003B79A06B